MSDTPPIKKTINIDADHHALLDELSQQDNRPLGAQAEVLIDQEIARRKAPVYRGRPEPAAN